MTALLYNCAQKKLLLQHVTTLSIHNQRIFTSGVSNMCLTCMRLVMCQVYLGTEPSGSPSSLTNADKTNRVSIILAQMFHCFINKKKLLSTARSTLSAHNVFKQSETAAAPVVKLGSRFFLEPRDRRCCRALKNSWGMWYTRGWGFPD